jgi:TPR repeat protein
MRRLALLSLFLAAAPAPAAPLGESLYPGLVEFDEAFEFYAASDFERARTGFRHLAELGDPEAQLNLGVMLAKGEGGPVDRIEGAAWVRRAEAGGLEQATAIREVLEGGLDQAQLDEIAMRLELLGQASELAASSGSTSSRLEPDRWDCVVSRIYRREPVYPLGALRTEQAGMVRMEFIIDPDGTAGAVHSLYGLDRADPLVKAAWDAVTQWHASACPGRSHRSFIQTIDFSMSEDGYTRAQRKEAARLLAAARSGDAANRFGVALLAATYPGLFDMDDGVAESLILDAAVQGLPEARHWLWIDQDDPGARRWALLAARQGYPPALYGVSNFKDLHQAERREALLQAARAGVEPALLHAVRWLAAHPDAHERDGALASQLTEHLSQEQLEKDMLLAQARAMALGEAGQFEQAAQLQKQTISTLRKGGRGTQLAEERLQAYETGQAWRDQTLVEDLGLASKD